MTHGISVVLPVRNGARWLGDVLTAIRLARHDGPLEVVAVDDGSTDGSRDVLARHAAAGRLTLLDGPRQGAAAALNLGVRSAAHPFIAQIDQDVVIAPEWFERLLAPFSDPMVAAAQGHYVAATGSGPWARVTGLDLRQRYARVGSWTDHACTGNSMYRKSAIEAVGLFDESLGYGYDNDLSYRLAAAGYRLAFCREATSVHFWREGLLNYVRQQYGFGYGRIDLVARHRRRVGGDDVSRLGMMLHAPLMLGALVLAATAVALALGGLSSPAQAMASLALAVAGSLALERFVAGARAAGTFKDPAGWWFAPAHLVRDIAWAWAIVVWSARRLLGRGGRPADSMAPRDG